ncbi:MAG: hypothetical protein WD377_00440 [Nitriliruptoraceae bacterium]
MSSPNAELNGITVFRREAEAASPKARHAVQSERLHDLVHRLTHAPAEFWRTQLADVDAREIRDIADLGDLPMIDRSQLDALQPWGVRIVPREMTVRAVISEAPATTRVVAYTLQDLRTIADLGARALVCVGAQPDDVLYVVRNPSTFASERGGEQLGATVVASSATSPRIPLRAMTDIPVHGIVASPGGLEQLDELRSDGVAAVSDLRYILVPSGEANAAAAAPLDDPTDGRPTTVRRSLDIVDAIAPAIGVECAQAPTTFHVFDDHYFPEIIDPETGRRRADGASGELLITTLTAEAMPLLRYRTGVTATMVREPCPCGRTHVRIRLAHDETGVTA